MSIQLTVPPRRELKPRIVVFGVGGGGGNAVNNMIAAGLEGVDFVVANTDAQALAASKADRCIQLGTKLTEGLGAGSNPDDGREAADEAMAEIVDMLQGAHMAFITAGMGGGTGTGAAPAIAHEARQQGILTVGVVTKPFDFEGNRRMRSAEKGIAALAEEVDTLLVIPNQNLFRVVNTQTTFAEAFAMADEVLHSGVSSITDLMVKPGIINLDFADVRAVMGEMGKAMMGTGEAEGENRAAEAAEAAIANPLLDDISMTGARGVLVNITGGEDMTLYEVDEAANRIKQEVDPDANIIIGTALDESLNGGMRVSVVATGIDKAVARIVADAGADVADAVPTAGDVVDISAAAPVPEPVAEAAPAEVAPPPPPVEDETEGFVPKKPMAAPPRAPSKRARGFLDRLFGAKEEEAGRPAPITPPPPPDEPLAAEADDMAIPPVEATPVVSAPEPEAQEPETPDEPEVPDAPDAVEATPPPPPPETAPVRPAAKREAPPPAAEPEETPDVAPPPPVAPAAQPEVQPAAQSAAQTTMEAKASYDGDQLDIPAFLRR